MKTLGGTQCKWAPRWGGKLRVVSEKIEKRGLAAVVTGEGPNSKTNHLCSRRVLCVRNSEYWKAAANQKKRGLESKPRGCQEIQNGRNTPANNLDGTVITTEKCRWNRRRSTPQCSKKQNAVCLNLGQTWTVPQNWLNTTANNTVGTVITTD